MTIDCMYIIGSLRNENIIKVGNAVRELGIEAFDDWWAAGPEADDCWRDYEKAKGHDYPTALKGWAARHVFDFDVTHLNRSDGGILVLPAGRSAHLELGFLSGQGKLTYILLEGEPERFDVMYQFATGGVFSSLDGLMSDLKGRMV